MAAMMDFSDVLLDEFDMLEQEMENYDNALELDDDSLLFDLLDQLHERNVQTLEGLGATRSEQSRSSQETTKIADDPTEEKSASQGRDENEDLTQSSSRIDFFPDNKENDLSSRESSRIKEELEIVTWHLGESTDDEGSAEESGSTDDDSGDESSSRGSSRILEIITRPDGTKVRRIRQVKAKEAATTDSVDDSTGSKPGAFLDKGFSSGPKKSFSGSHSAAGDQNIQGEIYVRPDGKKARRVKKVKPLSSAAGATVAADTDPEKNESTPETEIYTRPDGTTVRRIRRPKKTEDSGSVGGEKKTLAGIFSNAGPKRTKMGGSASVAGDMIAVDKSQSLTGEVYVRADGKKVRRVKKAAPASSSGDNVEIITRPDGTKVRRIRKTNAKPKPEEGKAGGLSGFLGSQPKSKPKGGAATVGGDVVMRKEMAPLEPLSGEMAKEIPAPTPEKKKDSKEGGDGEGGDNQGESYVRPDGKKVRRVRKPAAPTSGTTSSGEQYEIYVRPDGKKVRRIKRNAKQHPTKEAAAGHTAATVAPGDGVGKKPLTAGAATVAGDQIKSSFKPETAVAKPPAPSGPAVSKLLPADEETATKYRRMLKMGMPEGAVQQKMLVDGIAQKILDSVVAGEVPAPPLTPAVKY
jgi:hypothetical protein